ncbi:MAG: YdcF family protein [Acidobacteriota bacterium]
MIEDPLQPARAVVVLGGHLPFRAMEAARIYRQGWTKEIWLTQGAVPSKEDLALMRLGIVRPFEADYSRQVIERLGVPGNDIRVLPQRPVNTVDELRAIASELHPADDRVILVTSKYHTRRVRALWHSLVGGDAQAVVRFTPDDPFEPERWWRNRTDAMAVTHEWFGFLNASLGFRVKSER